MCSNVYLWCAPLVRNAWALLIRLKRYQNGEWRKKDDTHKLNSHCECLFVFFLCILMVSCTCKHIQAMMIFHRSNSCRIKFNRFWFFCLSVFASVSFLFYFSFMHIDSVLNSFQMNNTIFKNVKHKQIARNSVNVSFFCFAFRDGQLENVFFFFEMEPLNNIEIKTDTFSMKNE